MKSSEKGAAFIASFEGYVAHAYIAFKDEPYPTYGYGHMGPDVKVGEYISQADALALLHKDLNERFAPGVSAAMKVKLDQHQFDALVSLAYNIGVANFGAHDFVKALNASHGKGMCAIARPGLMEFIHGQGGIVYPGLERRRRAEAHLFCSDHYAHG